METLVNIILFIALVVNLALGAVIFSRGYKQITNILFGFIGVSSALWSAALIAFYTDLELFVGINWVKTIHFLALSIALFFTFFTIYFPRRKFSRTFLIFPVFVFLLNTYWIISSDAIVGEALGRAYEIGKYFIYYAVSIILLFGLGFIFLGLKLKSALEINEKKQIKYILIGSVLSSSLAIIPNLILPYLGTFDYTWLGPIFTLIIVSSIFLAIIRFGLFDIKVILTEVFAGIIIATLSIELFLVKSTYELVIKLGIFGLVIVFAFLLVRGVTKEVQAREHIEKLAKDLSSANEQLQKISALKSEFVSVATHQLRGPLTAIKGYSSMILDGSYGEVPESFGEPISRIHTSTISLAQVVQDFLDVSRIEQGSMKYEVAAFNFADLVKEVVNEVEPNIKASRLNFEFIVEGVAFSDEETDQAERNQYVIKGDRLKIKQVVANLIDNAIKYTKEGGVYVRVSLREKSVIFSVTDSGVGIEKNALRSLFQKFERAEGADQVNVSGTGLGLYIAKEIVEAHRGKIWAESEGLGKGSTFIIELPK